MAGLFTTVWKLSVVGSYTIFFVLLVRMLLHKSPKWCSYLLWSVVFLRLILPVVPESSFSLVPSQVSGSMKQEKGFLADGISKENAFWAEQEKADPFHQEMPEPDTVLDNTYTENTPGGGAQGITLPEVISYLWLAGVLAFGGYHMWSYYRFKKRLQGAVAAEQGVYELPGEHVSFIMGVVRPGIYLSNSLDEETRRVVLCHEQVHLRRRDYLIKPLTLAICCVHWFNPLVWLAFYLMSRDCEMSCDEKVVSILGEDSKKLYSFALLDEATGGCRKLWKRGTACAVLSFGEDSIKSRIKHVLHFKKAPGWLVAVSTVVLVVVLAGLCVNGKQVTDDDTTETESLQKPADGSQDVVTSETAMVYEEYVLENGQSIQIGNTGVYEKKNDQLFCMLEDKILEGKYVIHVEGGVPYLYYVAASDYAPGDWEIEYDSLRKVNLTTGASIYVPFEEAGWLSANNSGFSIGGGFVRVQNGRYVLQDAGKVWDHKTVAELSQEQKNAYAAANREYLLNHPGEVVAYGNRFKRQTDAYIDMDGDGDAERIAIGYGKQNGGYYPYDCYILKVDNWEEDRFANRLNNEIWAVSPDGEHIYILLYEEGASADPLTTFFRYEEGRLVESGSLSTYVEHMQFNDGKVKVFQRRELVQTDGIMSEYGFDEQGSLQELLADRYEYRSYQNDEGIVLQKEMTLYTEPGGEESFVIQPQRVEFMEVDKSLEWIRLEAADGQTGWFKVTGMCEVYGSAASEWFTGLQIAG